MDKRSRFITVQQFNHLLGDINRNNEHNKNPEFNIANSLFGVLDSDYATKMAIFIKYLKGNDAHLEKLNRKLISFIESSCT